MDQPQPQSDGLLSGIVVVELGDSAAAPFAGHVLACLGAEVWKIERPGSGDPSRSWGGPSDSWQNAGAIFHALNRGKKSVVIDVKNAADLERLKAFIDARADVFFHNLRPGTAGAFGLDETALTRRKPSLVYCTVGAFGARGPMNRLPGFDPLMQAYSGIMSVTGEEGQAPVRAGVSLVDFGTGLWAAFGIMTALYARQGKGTGTIVDSSLFETAIGWMSANPPGAARCARVKALRMLIHVPAAYSWSPETAPSNNMWRRFRVAFVREFEVPMATRLR